MSREHENLLRTAAYRKDEDLERRLAQLNEQLRESLPAPAPSAKLSQPMTLVIGLQRSGTSLLMQLLTQSFRFTYPDSIVARFWEAPHLGVTVSRSIRVQIAGAHSPDWFVSDYGVSQDVLGPHEFGNFWTKWFSFEPAHELTPAQLQSVDLQGLQSHLALMEQCGAGPLLFKVVPLGMNAAFLAQQFPTARFVFIRREPLYVAQSTYLARINRYGDPHVWWSLRPSGYERLRHLSPTDQIAAQVTICEHRIARELAQIEPSRVLRTSYESLCADPRMVLQQLGNWLQQPLQSDFVNPGAIADRNFRQVEQACLDELAAGLQRYQGERIE